MKKSSKRLAEPIKNIQVVSNKDAGLIDFNSKLVRLWNNNTARQENRVYQITEVQ